MQTRVKFLFTIVAVVLAAVALAACASGGSSSAASSASASGSASASASSASSSVAVLDGQEFIEINLNYNAGTGYEWTCKAEPEGVLNQLDKITKSDSEDQDVAGGPLTDTYVFMPNRSGEVTLTFELVRPWEKDESPAQTQVYAFTVSDELHAVLNPYKSDFENEPLISNGA